uniref:SH2 domain-containing protein n=1 Tax=Steinernema glaseri TaxID=37863 RepID=A0A1I7Y6D4_9BILA
MFLTPGKGRPLFRTPSINHTFTHRHLCFREQELCSRTTSHLQVAKSRFGRSRASLLSADERVFSVKFQKALAPADGSFLLRKTFKSAHCHYRLQRKSVFSSASAQNGILCKTCQR